MIRLLSYGALISILYGCATPPPAAPPVFYAVITNGSSNTISQLQYQDCQSDPNTWYVFHNQPIARGARVDLQLTRPCMNLRALNTEQKEVGQQWAIKNIYPFSWYIR